MTWNYRIIRYKDGALGLHEIHYDDAGEPKARTSDLADFGCDEDEGPQGIVKSLRMALNDAETQPVLDDWEAK